MISRRNFITAITTGVAATALLSACGNSGDSGAGTVEEPTVINYTWWGNEDRAERSNKAIALFNEQNPTIKVVGTFTDWAGYWQKRSTEAAGGGLPDVMQWDLSYLRDYAQRNQLLDLGAAGVDLSGFEKTLLPSGKVSDKQFAVPTGTNAFAIYYDPAKLKEIGVAEPTGNWSYAEYKKFLQDAGQASSGKYFGSSDYTGVWWQFNIWLRQNKIEAFTADGKLGFTKADLKKWWGSVSELRGTPAMISPDKVTQLLPKSPFGANATVSEPTWDNFMGGYLGDSGAAELKMVAVPSDDPENLGLFLKPAMLMVASAKTKNAAAAAKFIDFMVNSPEVGEIFKTTRGVPASKVQRDGTTFEGVDAQVVAYEDSISKYLSDAPEPPIVGFGTLESEFLRIQEELNFGKVDVDKAVDQWFISAEDVIKQNV